MKKIIVGALLIIILINSCALTAFFFIHTHLDFIERRDREIRGIEQEMFDRLDSFSVLIKPFEEQARNLNEKILMQVYEDIVSESGNGPGDATNGRLRQLVEPFGYVDVYIIDKTGTVVRSSFEGDIGLNMLGLESNFSDFIQSIYGKGRIFTQRLSLSNMNGRKMIYSYFSPEGSEWILETSVSFEDFLRKRYSDELYAHFFDSYFDRIALTYSQLNAYDLVYQTKVSTRSILTGSEVLMEPEVNRAIETEGEYIFRDWKLQKVYIKRKMKKQEFDFVQYPILYLEYDLGSYYSFLLKFYLLSSIGTVLLMLVISLIVYRVVERKMVCRIEELTRVLQTAAEENYGTRVMYSSKIGELMVLAKSTNRLIELVQDREGKLRSALRERESLLEEINHRVKNNLNVVVSLLNLQGNQITSIDEAKEALEKTKNRIYSMAMTHERLYQSDDFSNVKMDGYIESLAGNVRSSFNASEGIHTEIHTKDISLPIGYAIPCGIIVNELLMNAFGHAFPDQTAGKIAVSLEKDADSSYSLTVQDNGIGLPENFSLSSLDTLGLILVETLTKQINGILSIDSDSGAVFRVTFDLPQFLQFGD